MKDIERSCAVVIKELEENEKRPSETDFLLENKLSTGDDARDPFNMHLRQLWDSNLNPTATNTVLNADVPEFYPKHSKQNSQDFYLPDNVCNESITPGYCGLGNHPRHRRDYSFSASSVSVRLPNGLRTLFIHPAEASSRVSRFRYLLWLFETGSERLKRTKLSRATRA